MATLYRHYRLGKIIDIDVHPLLDNYLRRNGYRQLVTGLGPPLTSLYMSVLSFTTGAMPFFRICEAGLMDIKNGKIVDLVVS